MLKACKGKRYAEELEYVTSYYKDYLEIFQLASQLCLLTEIFATVGRADLSVSSVLNSVTELPVRERLAFSAVWTVLKLLVVMPATNATSERSFSALDE